MYCCSCKHSVLFIIVCSPNTLYSNSCKIQGHTNIILRNSRKRQTVHYYFNSCCFHTVSVLPLCAVQNVSVFIGPALVFCRRRRRYFMEFRDPEAKFWRQLQWQSSKAGSNWNSEFKAKPQILTSTYCLLIFDRLTRAKNQKIVKPLAPFVLQLWVLWSSKFGVVPNHFPAPPPNLTISCYKFFYATAYRLCLAKNRAPRHRHPLFFTEFCAFYF